VQTGRGSGVTEAGQSGPTKKKACGSLAAGRCAYSASCRAWFPRLARRKRCATLARMALGFLLPSFGAFGTLFGSS